MKFDLVNSILTDAEIKELQALCAETVSDILADINDHDTLKAAKRWIKQVLDELYALMNERKEEKEYTFDSHVRFMYNRCKYDKRFNFQTEFYTTRAKIVANRLLKFEDRWSDDSLMILVSTISEGLQGWYDSGRKIPKNQWWEEDFEVDRVLWRIMTAYVNDNLYQRDTPSPASTWIVKESLVTNCITSYMRCVMNACALCALLEETYGPKPDKYYYVADAYDRIMIQSWSNLSRLLPGLIDKLNLVYTFIEGGVR